MLASAVLDAFQSNSIKEAVALNNDFQKRYKSTEFARLLMEEQNRSALILMLAPAFLTLEQKTFISKFIKYSS